MKSISKLKDEARKYEQREEWEKAIQGYLEVLRVADEEEAEVELPLYNRLGDLCVRLGRPEDAMRHYEQAADRYAEAGLYNNAIALCNKAMRYNPDRLELIRKLGQFSALQGFITDARRYFLDYAERQFNAGHVDDALAALEDFANVADDADVREMLGRRMHAHGRTKAAVAELQRAYAMRVEAGDTERANALRSELQAMDPNAVIENAPAAGASRAPAAAVHDLPGYMEPDDDTAAAVPDEPDTAVADDAAPFIFADDVADEGAIEAGGIEIAGLETELESDTGPAAAGTHGIEGLETTAFDFSTVDADSVLDPGILRDDVVVSEGDVFALPDETDDDASFDLPLLDDDPFGDAGPAIGPASEAEGLQVQPDPGPEPLDLGSSFSFELPGGSTNAPGPDRAEAAFDLPLLGMEDASSPPAGAGADDDGIDLPAFDGKDDFDTSPPGWEPEPAPTFDLPAYETEAPAFELPTLDEPESDPAFDLPEPQVPFDLPLLDEPDTSAIDAGTSPAAADEVAFERSLPDDVTAWTFDAPQPPGPEAESDLPSLVEPDAGLDLSQADAQDSGFDLPLLEEPDTGLELPPLDELETGFDLPELAEPAAPAAQPIEIPPIELPTWDMPPAAPDAAEPATAKSGAAEEWPEIAEIEGATGAAAASAGVDREAWPEDLAEPALPETAEEPYIEAGPTPWLDDFAELTPGEAPAGAEEDTGTIEDAFDADAGFAETTLDDVEAATGGSEPAAPGPAPAIEDGPRREQSAAAAAREMAAAPPPDQLAGTPRPDEYVDLGALLAEDADEGTTRFRIQETAPTGDEDRDFAELLNQFKAKVHEHLPIEDAAAHYDLGLAFKEMGLIDEAIGEFQVALRAGHMRLRVYEELGGCFLVKEQYNIAEKVLTRALEMKFDHELELLGVYYHLGRAYEALGRRDQARDAYERVLGMDINFEDVTDRLARL